MLEQTKLKHISKGYEEVNLSLLAFKVKYNALPGDMSNATDIWGTHGAGGATANGDGNGQIPLSCAGELRRVFEHMTLAELYGGTYDADSASNPTAARVGPGYAFPSSRVNPAMGMSVGVPTAWSSQALWRHLSHKHIIFTMLPNGNCLEDGYEFTSRESWEFDVKFDDGQPSTGKIGAFGGHMGCVVWASPPAYIPANITKSCDLLYILQGL